MRKSEKYITSNGIICDVWPLGENNVVIEINGRRTVRNRQILNTQLQKVEDVALTGDKVALEFLETGEKAEYELVESYSGFRYKRVGGNHYSYKLEEYTESAANPALNSISTDSPLGRSLYRKTRGSIAEYNVGDETMRVRILGINKKAVS